MDPYENETRRYRNKNMIVERDFDNTHIRVRKVQVTGESKYEEAARVWKGTCGYYINRYMGKWNPEICVGCARSLQEAVIAVALLNELGVEDVPQITE